MEQRKIRQTLVRVKKLKKVLESKLNEDTIIKNKYKNLLKAYKVDYSMLFKNIKRISTLIDDLDPKKYEKVYSDNDNTKLELFYKDMKDTLEYLNRVTKDLSKITI